METELTKLLKRAAKALPPQRPTRASWAPLVPVVRTLQANGFNTSQAVDWLVAEGRVTADQRPSAYKSLRRLLLRADGKEAK